LSEKQSEHADTLSPFAVIYRYGGARDKPVSWEQYLQADKLATQAAGALGLPTNRDVRYAGTEKLSVLFPDGQGKEVLFARLAFTTGLHEQVRLLQGEWPKPWDGRGPIDVLVSETTSSKYTLLVGDTYRLAGSGRGPQIDVTIRVAGIWRAIDPESNYWFQPP